MPQMLLFALATLLPFGLLCFAATLGGVWVVVAIFYMGGLTAILDQVPVDRPNAPEGTEFPAADALLLALGLAHLAAFPMVIWVITGSDLALWEKMLVGLTAGQWFAQVSNPCAHELIHRGNRGLYMLGVTIYSTMLFGHHATAHRLVHHRHAASLQDPNTAREGETFYQFWVRAWRGSFREGWRVETARRASKGGVHPYLIYGALSTASLAFGLAIGGLPGVLLWLFLAVYAHSQLLLADYVQHYGLLRKTLPNGKLEPVSARHSWNAPQWFSSALMLNAPRHSDHHAYPSRPYPALRLPEKGDAPYLPYPLPVCCTLALVPQTWRRVMGRELEQWRQDAPQPEQ